MQETLNLTEKKFGCLQAEKHTNEYGTRLYWIWHNMKARCLKEGSTNYEHYGGRGIKVCEEWKSFVPFRDWAHSSGYDDSLTIERIDVNGNYEPSNCRWATMKEQANNKRTSHYFTYHGETKTIKQWSEEKKINRETLRHRILAGWSEDEVFEKEPKGPTYITYQEETRTASEWSKILGIRKKLILERLRKGMPIEKVLAPTKFCEPKYLTCDGITRSLSEWQISTGINKTTICARLKSGWSVEETLKTPISYLPRDRR